MSSARKELRRKLYDFLISEQISIETNLINTLLFEMMDVKLNNEEDMSRIGFDLSERSWDKNQNIQFRLPKLLLPELFKVLKFFNISQAEYQINSPLEINKDYLFNEILPKLFNYYKDVKATRPADITKYRIQSKAILDESATTTLKQYTQKAIDTILTDDNFEEKLTLNDLANYLMCLKEKNNSLQNYPVLYSSIVLAEDDLRMSLKDPDVRQNAELSKQISLVIEGIQLFAKYNRSDAIQANRIFEKEMEERLNKLKISHTQCKIVEDMLLSLMDVQLGKKGKATLEIGYDAARMVLKLDDIDQANTDKIIKYMQDAGDQTAIEGDGYRKYSSAIPESIKLSAASLPYHEDNDDLVEKHSVEMDGKFFYTNMLPRLIACLENMISKKPENIENYQDLSRNYFKRKQQEESVKDNKSLLFSPKSAKFSAEQSPSKALDFTALRLT